MLSDNKPGTDLFPWPLEGPKTSGSRAVLVGQVWSADLAEALHAIYSPLFNEGSTLEDVSRMMLEPFDDRSGD